MYHRALAQQDPIRVLLLGLGQMGSGIARLINEKPGLQLVGAFGRRKEHIGLDLGPVIGLNRDLQIPIAADLGHTIQSVKPQIAIHATCSRLADGFDEIAALLRHGVSVISIAEELAFPEYAPTSNPFAPRGLTICRPTARPCCAAKEWD